MLTNMLIAQLRPDPQTLQRSQQALRQVSISRDDTSRHTISFASHYAVGKLIAVVNGTTTRRTAHQRNAKLLAPLTFNLALNTLKASQADRRLLPTKHTQRRQHIPTQMMGVHRLVNRHIHSGILYLRVNKTIWFGHSSFSNLKTNISVQRAGKQLRQSVPQKTCC